MEATARLLRVGQLAHNESCALAQQIIEKYQLLISIGLNSLTSGNFSARIKSDPGLMVITPSSIDKYDGLNHRDMPIVVIENGAQLEGSDKRSSEWQAHSHIYLASPEINSVIHTHGGKLITLVQLEGPEILNFSGSGETVQHYLGGRIAVLKDNLPAGTKEVAEAIAEEVKKGAAIVVWPGHGDTGGIFGVGKDIRGAVEAVIYSNMVADQLLDKLSHQREKELLKLLRERR